MKEGFGRNFWNYFDRLIDGMTILAGALLIFITAAVCYTIGMRFLFTRTTLWTVSYTHLTLPTIYSV